jgi:signal transduction histidine kinase
VRDLQVTAARALLRPRTELFVPDHVRPAHRRRSAVWMVLHLTAGAITVAALTMFLPAAVVAVLEAWRGHGILEHDWFGVPGTVASRVLQGVIGGIGIVVTLGLWWPMGRLMAHLAPRFLGPTPEDRVALAEARVRRESEQVRIARDLHDGVGHALTAISIQAQAGSRVSARDPEAAAAALDRIGDVAREALEDLDAMLGVLREEEDPTAAAANLHAGIAALVSREQDAGMDLRADVDLPGPLAGIEGRHLLRITTELLTNARKHGGPGPVGLRLTSADDVLVLEVHNPRGRRDPSAADPGTHARIGGRGLAGIRERADLLGGTLEAGREGEEWVARVRLPLMTVPTTVQEER